MNNTTKSKENAESEMHDYDYKTKKNVRPCKQTPLDEYRSSHEVISQTIDKILNIIKD